MFISDKKLDYKIKDASDTIFLKTHRRLKSQNFFKKFKSSEVEKTEVCNTMKPTKEYFKNEQTVV